MSDCLIVPIVEGYSEVASVPILLRRMLAKTGHHELTASIGKPIRVKRNRIVKEGELEREIAKAKRCRPGCRCVLVLLDADDDCPAELGPSLLERARSAHADLRISVVLAKREFEAWFLGSIESLRGKCGISHNACFKGDPELPRDAKGHLSKLMEGGRHYLEVLDQPRLISAIDVLACHNRCDSFRKLERDVKSLFNVILGQDE